MGPKGCGELDTCCTLSLKWDISEKLGSHIEPANYRNMPTAGLVSGQMAVAKGARVP